MRPILRRLAEKAAGRLKRAELAAHTVTLKLKTADFRIRTRARPLSDPTRLADRIFRAAEDLLAREVDGTAFRLIGVSLSQFADPALADPDDLLDPAAAVGGRRPRRRSTGCATDSTGSRRARLHLPARRLKGAAQSPSGSWWLWMLCERVIVVEDRHRARAR